MDRDTMIRLLKLDLQRMGELPGDDEYLPTLIDVAISMLARQGIQQDQSMDYGQTVVGTAAWIYRKRITGETEPAYLRRLRLDLLLARGRPCHDP